MIRVIWRVNIKNWSGVVWLACMVRLVRVDRAVRLVSVVRLVWEVRLVRVV